MIDPVYAASSADRRRAAERLLWRYDEVDTLGVQPLRCVLDAGRDARIYRRLRHGGSDLAVLPLYDGAAAAELAAVAPYLVELDPGDALFDWIWEEGWGRRWGVFLWSGASLEVLRAHFRRLTRVRTEDAQILLFRFYDPGVLRQFLPTCDAAQLAEMFGPVEAYFIESPDGAALEQFWRSGEVLEREFLELNGAVP